MTNPRDIIVRPLVTEKTIKVQEENNTVVFEVKKGANKILVKQAVESMSAPKKASVSTQAAAPKKDFASIVMNKPKAVAKKKETPQKNKPYIAQSMNGLTKGAPTISADGPGYAVGDRVRHIKFGEGTVQSITREPKDYKVTVSFDLSGNKIMYAAFARLEKI